MQGLYKSWKTWKAVEYMISIPGLESHGILVEVCFWKIKRQKDKKFDKWETGLNFSTRQTHILCIMMLENMLLNYCFDATIRTNA